MSTAPPETFRARFRRGDLLLGTFVKTPATHPVEILGAAGLDFVVIDEEHAPFDRVAIDNALLAARASGTAGIVRVAELSAAKILAVLDDGAEGVLAPHVSSVEKARALASACRYRGGSRGFSNSPRAGGYGDMAMWPHVEAQDQRITAIAMIEDPEALDVIDDILAVEGLDGVFVGRGDLSVAMGAASPADPKVRAAAERVIRAARAAGKPVCIMVGAVPEADEFRQLGASAFIVSSDQGLMRQAALGVARDFAAMANGAAAR